MQEVSCAIIIKGGRILLTQRSESMTHPLKWEFPGGKIKPGESPESCILREIKEELNAIIEVKQQLPSLIFDYGSGRIKLIPFICILHSETLTLEQHKAYSWIQKKDMRNFDMLDADLEILKTLKANWEKLFL